MSKNRIPASDAQHLDKWQIPEMPGVTKSPSLHFQHEESPVTEQSANLNSSEEAMTVGQLTAGELAQLSEQIYQEVYQQAFQEGREAGYQEGFATGQQEGHQQAFQQHEATLVQQAQGFTALSAQLNQSLAERDTQFSHALSELVSNLARTVLQRELSVEQTQIEDLVQLCISKLPHDVERVDIFVNPQDVKFLQENNIHKDEYRIHPDPNLPLGSCRVSDGLSTAEYIIGDEFNELIQQIFQQYYFAEEALQEGIAPVESAQEPPVDFTASQLEQTETLTLNSQSDDETI